VVDAIRLNHRYHDHLDSLSVARDSLFAARRIAPAEVEAYLSALARDPAAMKRLADRLRAEFQGEVDLPAHLRAGSSLAR
jgi:hypothetical protein